MRWLGPLVLGTSLALAAFVWWPEISHRWGETAPPPISIPDATAHWVNDKQFDIEAPTFYWNDTCPSIWVTWWVQTRWHGSVPVTTEAVIGPFKDRGPLPPRYQISIAPQVGSPLHLRVTIPDWLSQEDVLLVAVDDVVPDNEQCESGWIGTMQVFRLQIEPARK